jgi:hypothetical protein
MAFIKPITTLGGLMFWNNIKQSEYFIMQKHITGLWPYSYRILMRENRMEIANSNDKEEIEYDWRYLETHTVPQFESRGAPALCQGCVIFVNRGLYKHYGIYNNNQNVIHFSPDSGKEVNAEDAYIRETTLAAFLKGGEVELDRSVCAAFPPEEVVRRATQFVDKGRGEYDLIFNNCEHFARWCASGEKESKQVETGVAVAAGVAAAVIAVLISGNHDDRS